LSYLTMFSSFEQLLIRFLYSSIENITSCNKINWYELMQCFVFIFWACRRQLLLRLILFLLIDWWCIPAGADTAILLACSLVQQRGKCVLGIVKCLKLCFFKIYIWLFYFYHLNINSIKFCCMYIFF
jgi:hypothetical protein